MPRAGYSSAGRRSPEPTIGRWPLIEVQGLTKHYNGRAAVVDLTFSVPRGQVLGLLGPDGAGKSTAMRILAGCAGATAGAAPIPGRNVRDEPREARPHLGYPPPRAPLYDATPGQPLLAT